MALTPELVAGCHRAIEDTGPEPGVEQHSEADYDAATDAILAGRRPDADVWLFAYGSLIWKPEFDHAEERPATAHGWHRSFCLKINRWRGTRDRPGLMMALDRGGQCKGVAYRIAGTTAREQVGRLLRREMTVKPPSNMPRWLRLEAGGDEFRAIGFVVNRRLGRYAGRLPLEETASILAAACGHWGSGAEYLYNTVSHLEERGIRDRNLWRLQALVAQEIERTGAMRQETP